MSCRRYIPFSAPEAHLAFIKSVKAGVHDYSHADVTGQGIIPCQGVNNTLVYRKTETKILCFISKRQGITCVGLGKSIGNDTHSKTKNVTNTQECWMTV